MKAPNGMGVFGGQPTPPPGGLTFWFDGSAPAYSNFAGSIVAGAPYGRVARVDQRAPAPAGQWLTSNETTLRGWRDARAIDIQYGPPVVVAQPGALSVNANSCVWGFTAQARSSVSVVNTIYFGDDGVSNWGALLGPDLQLYAASTSFSTGIVVPPGAIVSAVIKYTPTTIDVTATVDGVLHTFTTAASNNNHVTRNLFLGQGFGGTYHSQSGIAQVLGYAGTTVDVSALLAFLRQSEPTGFPVNAPLVVVGGDSISQGVTATTSSSEFYQAQVNLAGNATPPRLLNAGLANLDLTGLIARYPTEVRPFYNAARAKNILCVQCMTNSMPCSTVNAAATAAAVLAQYYAYCDTARADGWIVIAYTCLPRSDASAGTGFPTAWNIVNTDIRANYLSHAADLCDAAGVAGMSTILDAAGANFSDQLHPSNAGQALQTVPTQAAITRRLALP